VPAEIAQAVYGRTDLVYIVCAPLPDGTQPPAWRSSLTN